MHQSIDYFSEDINFKLKRKKEISLWLQAVIEQEGYALEQLNFIFCSDSYLHGYNKHYLNHDTLTDVITFDYATKEKTIYGDIYISIERIKENAAMYQEAFLRELYRVMLHGLLHLLTYKDATLDEKKLMRAKEAYYLTKRSTLT
ncbi:MAG: rRNA maturation RNase YbeY [Candidatus Cardinium sp.]|uniref:Endoribonuclease YbeY n=1 Tax=Candidatus Cardinium hertigii TaxID=247481 RepID=A0A2Z3L9P7_9BACT|nr:rRNA maturation RNase YbeY [Candidatus Cardinium hertigii]AWN82238.1 Endoribonuclease YbeY [Candidatus Cardinium hertigii]MDD9140062.1 rRNA maturation RNase YbeY [Candidatus Cardinium sp.]